MVAKNESDMMAFSVKWFCTKLLFCFVLFTVVLFRVEITALTVKPRSSIYLERKAPAFFATFKLLEFSKNDSNMVCTSPKKQQISRVSRVWLKNYVRHALLKFEIVLAGNPFWVKLGTSNLVESWKLMSTTTGENLVLISQTFFE